jgi:hypothetical protein
MKSGFDYLQKIYSLAQSPVSDAIDADFNRAMNGNISANMSYGVRNPAIHTQAPLYGTQQAFKPPSVNTANTSNPYQPTNNVPGYGTVKGKVYYGTKNPFTNKVGNKATRNNNPGNITGMGGKLLYGAIGFNRSNTGDRGDRMQLVFKTPQDGFKAMHQLALNKYSNAPIRTAFDKWQTDKKSFKHKLSALKRAGIDINKKYSQLSPEEQFTFRRIWSRYEGYRGQTY